MDSLPREGAALNYSSPALTERNVSLAEDSLNSLSHGRCKLFIILDVEIPVRVVPVIIYLLDWVHGKSMESLDYRYIPHAEMLPEGIAKTVANSCRFYWIIT